MKRRYTALASVALAAVLLALTVRFGRALAFSLALSLPTMETWLAPLLPAPTREELTLDVRGRPLHADLYRPPKPRQAILLVHGLSRAGRRHAELVRLARLLAEHGALVLVPHFESLAAFRLDGREVEEIGAALAHLRGASGPVALAAFSFGAGPALVAAAEVPGLRLVGSFGGYADLRNVVAYVTTGVHTFGGRRYVERQEEYNRWKLLALLVGFVETARDRTVLEAIVETKLDDPAIDTAARERDLGEEGRRMLALVLNRREDAVAPLLARLQPRAREALDRLSPLSAVPRLSARLLIAHGAGDTSIPFTESLRLAEAANGRARAVILRTFHHTGPRWFWQSVGDGVVDLSSLVRLADELTGAR